VAALQTVAHLVTAGTYRCALIVSSERPDHSLNPAEPASAVLFGAAAAAAVVTRAAEGESSAVVWEQFATYSESAELTAIRGGGTLHHPNDPATTPEMNLFHMDGPQVYRRAARLAAPFFERFFQRSGWTRESVDSLISHQASRHAVEYLWRRLGFRQDQVVENLAERGNTVAASIPLTLAEARDQGRIKRGDRVMLFGTGAGLSIAAIALVF
jgi:3-oxoacyl-[acyl-carrier-protein] synthase-3